jgi:transcriptional regulator with XRE-family HTH domain
MTNHPAAELVAREVRAELARQRKTAGDLAAALGVTPHTIGRRLSGETHFTIVEVAQIALFLGVPLRDLVAGLDGAA